jgi:hypothetical protein
VLDNTRRRIDVSGRFHYYRGIVRVQENDAADISIFEELCTESGLEWNDYTTDEALAVLGGGYVFGYLNIEDRSAHLTWKEPWPDAEVLAEAEEAFRVWADGQGYEPWFAESG